MAERVNLADVERIDAILQVPYDYVSSYGQDNIGKKFNPHVSWALRQLAGADSAIARAEAAGDTEAAVALRRVLSEVEATNRVLFDKAAVYITAKNEDLFLERIRIATDALVAGETDTYSRVEQLLHETSPIDTEAVRARLAADTAVNQ